MKSSRSGQSIIEAMVAISILTVGLVGILTLLNKSFQLTRDDNDETTATYLASEGIEVAKNLIDYGVYLGIASNGTVGGWGYCFSEGSGHYQLDYETYDCDAGAIPFSETPYAAPIYQAKFGRAGSYADDSSIGPKTIFSRDIYIGINGDEIDVSSTVLWTDSLGIPESVNLEDSFYNWNPGD